MFLLPMIAPAVGAAIATGLASVIGAGVSAASSLRGTRIANEARKREAELAYRRQREQVREMNSYNSASAQMARLQAAGLNPNLMYESSQEAAAGTQSDFAKYEAAPVDNAFGQVGAIGNDMIQNLIGLKDMQNKTALTKVDIALKSYQGLREVAQTQVSTNEAQLLAQEWGFRENQNPLLLQKLSGEISKLEVDTEAVRKSWALTDAQVKQVEADANLKAGELERILTLLEPQKDEILEHIRLMVTQEGLNGANAHLAMQQSEYFRNLAWEVTQRYYLDKWNIEQNLNIAEKNYVLNAETLSEQIREFDKENARAWAQYCTDTFFKVVDTILELFPLFMKTPKIGF